MTDRNPFDFVKNINTKTGKMADDELAGYPQFIINRAFSNTRDTVFLANEANKFRDIPDSAHYAFYYHAVPKSFKRFGSWHKQPAKDGDVEIIMRVYGYSRAKAEEVYPLFADRLDVLRQLGNTGGRK